MMSNRFLISNLVKISTTNLTGSGSFIGSYEDKQQSTMKSEMQNVVNFNENTHTHTPKTKWNQNQDDNDIFRFI